MARKKRARKPKAPGVSLLMLRSHKVGAAEFKSRCLEIIDEVQRTRAEVVITKHRKPVARLVPFAPQKFVGCLKDAVKSYGDLVSPTGEEWEGDESNLT